MCLVCSKNVFSFPCLQDNDNEPTAKQNSNTEKIKKTERQTESFELEIKTKRTEQSRAEQNGVEQRVMVCRFVVVVFHLDAIKMNMNA